MSFLTRLFGKGKKKINLQVTKIGEEKPDPKPDRTGTTLRKPEGPELTALEMAQRKDWEIKILPTWKPGDVILDTYEVEDVISGGMGHVYITNHNKWNVKLAIKSPNKQMLSDRDLFARILREANSWTELGLHPNIAYCYYVRNIEDIPHIVVEYVNGDNLRKWIEDGKCIDYRTNLDLGIQFCYGMEYAHSKGMIHRDIKPENVLMTKGGILKITDFGLVRGQGPEIRGQGSPVRSDAGKQNIVGYGLTAVGTFMGSTSYISPEQAKDPTKVDERADIFSFGVCLYEMFCGNKPYETTYGKQQEAPDPVMLSKDNEFPPSLSTVLTKSVQWLPSDRYTSFKEIRQELIRIYRMFYKEESPYAELKLVDIEADGLNNQGVSYFELDRKEDALSCWTHALEINETHPEATYNLSLIQWRDAKFPDSEPITRLDNLGNNPSADKEKLAELKAYIHAERFAPDAAMDVLKDFPGRYEELFSKKDIGRIRYISIQETDTYGVYSKYVSGAITPDGQYIYGNGDGYLHVEEIKTDMRIRTMKGHTRNVSSIVVTPDGQYAISGSEDKTLRIWKLKTGRCVRTMKGHNFEVTSVAVTPDGQYAISGSRDQTLRVWKLKTGRCIRTMKGHTGWVTSVAITPDGKYAISGSWDHTLRMWELKTGKCIRTLEDDTYHVDSVAITPDGKYVISGGIYAHTLHVLELKTGRCIRTLEGYTNGVRSVAITPDGKYAISKSKDYTRRLWEISLDKSYRSEVMLSLPKGFEQTKKEIENLNEAISKIDEYYKKGDYPKSYAILLKTWENIGFGHNDAINRFSSMLMEKGRITGLIFCFQIKILKGHTQRVTSVAVTPDGQYAISGCEDQTLRVWELKTGRCILTLEGHTHHVTSVAVMPDGQYAISGCEDTTLRVWKLETGKCIRTLKGLVNRVYSVAVTPDGQYAISGCEDETLRVWELKTGRCIRTLKGHTNWQVDSVAVTPDGQYAISSGSYDNTLRVWELKTGKCIRTLEGHTYNVTSVAVTPDGQYAISGSGDRTLRVWKLETGRCLRTMEGPSSFVSRVSSVAITPDGRHAISGSYDSTLRVWELETGKCIRTLEGHTYNVTSVAVTPDSQYAISGSEDATLRVWEFIWDLEFPGPLGR